MPEPKDKPITTDLEVRNSPTRNQTYKRRIGNSLYLSVAPSGKKTWQFRFRLDGKANIATLGTFPAMGLAAARKAAEEARELVKQGINPNARKREQKRANLEAARAVEAEQTVLANTFASVAADRREQKTGRIEARTLASWWNQLANHAFPKIGGKPIAHITRPELVAAVRAIEEEVSSYTAGRVGQHICEVFSFAQDEGLIDANPATNLKRVLMNSHEVKHMEMLPPEQMPTLLQLLKLDPESAVKRPRGRGHEITRAAMLFTILTASRQKEVRLATWDEIDLDKRLWHRPAEHMKMRRPHTVPLTGKAVEVLDFMRFRYGGNGLIFCISKQDNKPLSENTMQGALKKRFKMNGDMHGFRAFFLTTAKNLGVFYERAVGAALAHQEETGYQSDAAYDRGDYLELRKPIMQWYADWLEAMQKSGKFEQPADFLPPELWRRMQDGHEADAGG